MPVFMSSIWDLLFSWGRMPKTDGTGNRGAHTCENMKFWRNEGDCHELHPPFTLPRQKILSKVGKSISKGAVSVLALRRWSPELLKTEMFGTSWSYGDQWCKMVVFHFVKWVFMIFIIVFGLNSFFSELLCGRQKTDCSVLASRGW